MAIEEHEKEDLLRQATQFQRRALIVRPDQAEVFIGLRNSGAFSVYLTQDFVVHFNSELEIRRVFDHGQKLAANCGYLESLVRTRRGGRVEFVRKALERSDELQLMERCRKELEELAHGLEFLMQVRMTRKNDLNTTPKGNFVAAENERGSSDFIVVGQVPADDEGLVRSLHDPLRKCLVELRVANSPMSDG